jgi:hypothetical protein
MDALHSIAKEADKAMDTQTEVSGLGVLGVLVNIWGRMIFRETK